MELNSSMESSTKLPETLENPTLQKENHDRNIVIFCFLFLFAGWILNPSAEAVFLAGYKIPELCYWKRMFGVECLGCGLTRSVCYTMHGDFAHAWERHILGTPIVFLVSIFGFRSLLRYTLSKWRA